MRVSGSCRVLRRWRNLIPTHRELRFFALGVTHALSERLVHAHNANVPALGTFTAETMTLMESELRPGGSRYTPLCVLPLGQPNSSHEDEWR